jgi:hypothetical protein
MFKNLFGDPNTRKLKKFQPYIAEVNVIEEDMVALSDDELKQKTIAFRELLDKAKTDEETEDILDEILPEAFAVVREAGKRVLGMRHFDVQLLGGIILHKGQIPTWLSIPTPAGFEVIHFHGKSGGLFISSYDKIHEKIRWTNRWVATPLRWFDECLGFPIRSFVPRTKRSEQITLLDESVQI